MNLTRLCSRCSVPNNATNQFCAQCGARLATTMFTPGIKVLFIVLGFVALGGIALTIAAIYDPKSFAPTLPPQTASTKPTSTPPPTPIPTPTPPTPAELLASAKRATGVEGATKEALGNVMEMLRAIPKEAKEYKEAQPLLDKTTKRWARLAAEELVLGPKPENSAWDGRVDCADLYLKNNLNDYDSSEYMEWSPVTRVDLKGEPYWAVRLKLRAKNAFGAFIIKELIFFIRQNQVVQAVGL